MVFHWNLSDRESSKVSMTQQQTSLDLDLDLSSNFQLFLPHLLAFGERSLLEKYYWYHRHSDFWLLWQKDKYLSSFFRSLIFTL